MAPARSAISRDSSQTYPQPCQQPPERRSNIRRRVRIGLLAPWAAWASAVAVDLLIWAMVSLGSGDAVCFWPMCVAGPWGIVLGIATVATSAAVRQSAAVERH